MTRPYREPAIVKNNNDYIITAEQANQRTNEKIRKIINDKASYWNDWAQDFLPKAYATINLAIADGKYSCTIIEENDIKKKLGLGLTYNKQRVSSKIENCLYLHKEEYANLDVWYKFSVLGTELAQRKFDVNLVPLETTDTRYCLLLKVSWY